MGESLSPHHDMHNRYGEVLTWKSLNSNQRYAQLWENYATDYKQLDHRYQELLVEYIEKFRLA